MFTYHDFLVIVSEYYPDCFNCPYGEVDFYGCYCECRKNRKKLMPCFMWDVLTDWYKLDAQNYYNISNPYDSPYKDYFDNYQNLCSFDEYMFDHYIPF